MPQNLNQSAIFVPPADHAAARCVSPERLLALRRTALEVMDLLAGSHLSLRCYLSGSVAEGNADEYADINIQVFADSAKEVEIFLLDCGLRCCHETPKSHLAEAVIVLEPGIADVNLVIYPANLERMQLPTRDGQPRPRLKPLALRRLIEADTSTSGDDA